MFSQEVEGGLLRSLHPLKAREMARVIAGVLRFEIIIPLRTLRAESVPFSITHHVMLPAIALIPRSVLRWIG